MAAGGVKMTRVQELAGSGFVHTAPSWGNPQGGSQSLLSPTPCNAGDRLLVKGINWMLMRTWIVAVLMLLLGSLAACEKVTEPEEEFGETAGPAVPLTGVWELAYSSGGNSTPQTYAPGNGNLLKFSDTHYEVHTGGALRWRETYTVVDDTTAAEKTCRTLPEGEFRQAIVQGSSGYRQFFEIRGRQLTLISGCVSADGGLSTYRKVSEVMP